MLKYIIHMRTKCEGEGDVVAVVAPLGGVAQVISHGVQVVGVGLHEEEEKEKDEEVRVEVKGEVVEELREKRSSWMAWR